MQVITKIGLQLRQKHVYALPNTRYKEGVSNIFIRRRQSDRLKNTFLPLKLLLVAALVLASFAHTAYSREIMTPSGYDIRAFSAQFVLPDGTLPVLCDQSGDGNPHHNSAVPCEFCLIAATALPAGAHTASSGILFRAVLHVMAPETAIGFRRPLYRTLSQSQAPPSV